MDNAGFTFYDYFVPLPALKAGFYDGINPCGFTAALILIIYLGFVGHTQRRVFSFGLLFIISAILVHFMLAAGIFDPILTISAVLSVIRLMYGLLAISFLIFGILDILDWRQYKKHCDASHFRCKLPVFLKDFQAGQASRAKIRIFMNFQFTLAAIFIAAIMTLAGSIYPQQEYIFIVHSFLMAGGSSKFAFMSFFQYGVASALPLIVVWFTVFCAGFTVREKAKAVSYYKGISSALYLSVGIVLGIFLLR